MTIAWVIEDSFVRKRSAFESESEMSKAFFTGQLSSIVSTGETAGEGVNTYLILKQLGVHNPRTAFRELADVATKEDRLTGFQRLVQMISPQTVGNCAMAV